jgi:uncharacterized protein (TIGR03435 family)
MFTAWQRALEDQLGLGIESRKDQVAVVVVNDAARDADRKLGAAKNGE